MTGLTIYVHKGALACPKCGAPELIPSTAGPNGEWIEGARWAIRPFKVDDWSQCLCCSGYLNRETFEPMGRPAVECDKGWFNLQGYHDGGADGKPGFYG